MRTLSIYALLLSSLSLSAHAQEIRLDDIVKKVSSTNYQVLGEAQKVYQAKESVRFSRGELLPSLNLWKIASAIVDPFTLISQDIAPFLVPANWFRLSQAEKLYLAEREGYRALWANELFTAKILFYQAHLDTQLAKKVESLGKDFKVILEIAELRQRLGGLQPGTAQEIRLKNLALEEDSMRLSQTLRDQSRQLAYVLGIPQTEGATLAEWAFPDPLQLPSIKPDDVLWRARSISPERRQHQHILEAIPALKGEIGFTILGLASNSRGTAGGVFDNIPVPSGLGFSTGPALRIAEAQKKRIELQLLAVEETLARDVFMNVENLDLEKRALRSTMERVAISEQLLEQLKTRIGLGDLIDPLAVSETYRNWVLAQTSYVQQLLKATVLWERIQRITFSGDYVFVPAVNEKGRLQ
jgi:outer membrane protein TolC